ncbi:MAG: U32 family peptidase, partial [Clostridia bacterium]|nr:U32 family peptidase [Clostridia bacterium]
MNNNIEILAPGGSFKSLKAAIDSGADAVYFGGMRFGARANAANLSNEEIVQAVKYASLRGAKLYVTVNTLADDSELPEVFEFLKFCYSAGVDGVIVQDLGIVNMIRTHFPDFRLHASTQMTIHNLDGVLQAQKMGFDRVVLSRELSFEEIKYIADNSDAELEVFVHGALCMSYSGQCLFSSFLGGRSGNRGQCAQPCRLSYTLLDEDENPVSEKDKYLLSLRDLCLVEHIESLRKAGVTSLKIEGRMKSEAYVSAVCGRYKKYSKGGKVLPEDKKLLESIFS